MGPVMRRIAVFGSLALCVSTLGLVACTSTEGPATPPPKDGKREDGKRELDPKPEPPAEPIARAAIASVQMIEDCPNQNDGWRPPPVSPGPAQAPAAVAPAAAEAVGDVPPPAPGSPMPPAEGPAASAARMAPGAAIAGGGGPGTWVQPCTQSTLQIVFSGQGDRTSTVVIEKVRLLDPKRDDSVATLVAREPAAWTDGAYQSWNQTIGPKQEVKASYELSVPDWAAVEEQIGGGSYGAMFQLEVDVKVDGELQRVRSAQFPREAPHVVAT